MVDDGAHKMEAHTLSQPERRDEFNLADGKDKLKRNLFYVKEEIKEVLTYVHTCFHMYCYPISSQTEGSSS